MHKLVEIKTGSGKGAGKSEACKSSGIRAHAMVETLGIEGHGGVVGRRKRAAAYFLLRYDLIWYVHIFALYATARWVLC